MNQIGDNNVANIGIYHDITGIQINNHYSNEGQASQAEGRLIIYSLFATEKC